MFDIEADEEIENWADAYGVMYGACEALMKALEEIKVRAGNPNNVPGDELCEILCLAEVALKDAPQLGSAQLEDEPEDDPHLLEGWSGYKR